MTSKKMSARTSGGFCGGLLFVPALYFLTLSVMTVKVTGEEIILSDIVAGGDGRGTAPQQNIGINADLGVFEDTNRDSEIPNTGAALQPVVVSCLIDSVFITDQTPMQINSQGVVFDFPFADVITKTWNHILKDKTQDVANGVEEIWAGGRKDWDTAVSVHASAGISFDLSEIRAEFSEKSVGTLSCFTGTDQCSEADVRLYIILSNDVEIIQSVLLGPLGANQGEDVQLTIPPEALFLTFAAGSNGDFCCDHAVFANAVIAPRDTDGDGIPDDEDDCPDSDLSPTLVFDGCDSGVENNLFADGCTISDLIADCADRAENHGQFVSCVVQLTKDLKNAGVITNQERTAIVVCAAQANIP